MREYEKFENSKVVVFGGLGFLGSSLAVSLVELGANVVLYDCLLPRHGGNFANIEVISEQVRVMLRDVRTDNNLESLVNDAEYVFCLAGQTNHAASMLEPQIDFEINCVANLKILEACRRAKNSANVVFASTRQVYGKIKSIPVMETQPALPTDINGIFSHITTLMQISPNILMYMIHRTLLFHCRALS